MTWDELPTQTQEDLEEWFNATEIDDQDRARLLDLYVKRRFAAFDCLRCRDRVFISSPENWDHFQGVREADFSSYPGREELTPGYNASLCDHCRCYGP